jgi:toxin ParE1/3/4
VKRRRILLLPGANADLDGSAEYYTSEGGLEVGLRFFSACQRTFEWLLENPGAGSPKAFRNPRLAGLRMWPVRGFEKHLVFYLSAEDGIRVVRVLHGARDIPRVIEAED